MKFSIRQATSLDIEEVITLCIKLAEFESQFTHNKPSPDQIRERVAYDFLERGRCAYFVAESDGNIIGIIKVARKENGHGKVSEAYVEERYRGNGIMTELFKEALKWSQSHGITSLYLTVVNGNKHAFAFWRKCGFSFESYIGDLLIKMSMSVSQQVAG
ncbi:MAG: GNAT family N-acetyltransferase [Candidatus Micrarchaeia archaeon]